MSTVSYLKKITDPNDIKLWKMEDVYKHISSNQDLSQTTITLHSYKRAELNAEKKEDEVLYKTEYERLKNTLESVVFSGEFSRRDNKSCTNYWANIVLDIDKINSEPDIAKIKTYFKKLPYTILIFKSPSGYGLKVVCKLQYFGESNINEYHKQAFLALKETHDKFLKKFNVEIDPSGKDLARTCYLCYDKGAIFNIEADTNNMLGFKFDYSPPRKVQSADKVKNEKREWYKYLKETEAYENLELIEDIIKFVDNNNIDITEYYDSWMTLLWTIKHALGEDGYPEFDALSRNYKEYDPIKTRKKWDENKLDPSKPKHTIGSLVYLCTKHGYTIPKTIKSKTFFWNSLIDLLTENQVFLRFEEDSGQYEILKNNKWTKYSDKEESTLRIDLFKGKITIGDMRDLIASITPSISKKQLFIKTLPVWDGVERYKDLAATLNAPNLEDNIKETFIRKWFIGAVAQLHNDGKNRKINENMIILSGPQYIGKTMWCNRLLPENAKEHFATKNVNLQDKDDHILLAEKWIVFLDEGLSLRKNDVRALKTLLSSDKFSGRAAYGRYNRDWIRSASFIASTNDEEILTDDTGNRRYWVIPTETIDFKHNIDIQQVWAESLKRYRDGEEYWLNKEEYDIVNELNKPYEIQSSLEYYIEKYIEPSGRGDHYCATEIRDHILSNEPKISINEYHIGRIMKKLGYEKKQGYSNGKRRLGYYCKFIHPTIKLS